ncbi:hypothetical protein DM02DRAFT_623761 [Periconia macrospinosa]|uniref:Uncharacterized protein n=1 Tax=Periconia macrospinosa TaxID=97972 RepID=A0A2V1E8Y0_9PLEO|nr:hypothetical protein DM02DRAFT_623761 [Periconia macrospinosa]
MDARQRGAGHLTVVARRAKIMGVIGGGGSPSPVLHTDSDDVTLRLMGCLLWGLQYCCRRASFKSHFCCGKHGISGPARGRWRRLLATAAHRTCVEMVQLLARAPCPISTIHRDNQREKGKHVSPSKRPKETKQSKKLPKGSRHTTACSLCHRHGQTRRAYFPIAPFVARTGRSSQSAALDEGCVRVFAVRDARGGPWAVDEAEGQRCLGTLSCRSNSLSSTGMGHPT